MFFGKNLIFLKVGLVFFVSSKENVFSNMDTLYLRDNNNQGHMKKLIFFGTPLIKELLSNQVSKSVSQSVSKSVTKKCLQIGSKFFSGKTIAFLVPKKF